MQQPCRRPCEELVGEAVGWVSGSSGPEGRLMVLGLYARGLLGLWSRTHYASLSLPALSLPSAQRLSCVCWASPYPWPLSLSCVPSLPGGLRKTQGLQHSCHHSLCRRGKSKVEKSTTLAELSFSEVIYRGGHQCDLFFVFSQQDLGDFHCDFEVCTVRTPKSICFSPRGMPFSRCLSLKRLR